MGNPRIGELGKATRFPVNRKDHTMHHPNGYLTCRFRKWLKRAMYPCRNPETNAVENVSGYDAVAVTIIKSALKGDMRAAEILLDRLEGKPTQKIETDIRVTKMNDVYLGDKPLEIELGETSVESPGATSDPGEVTPTNN